MRGASQSGYRRTTLRDMQTTALPALNIPTIGGINPWLLLGGLVLGGIALGYVLRPRVDHARRRASAAAAAPWPAWKSLVVTGGAVATTFAVTYYLSKRGTL